MEVEIGQLPAGVGDPEAPHRSDNGPVPLRLLKPIEQARAFRSVIERNGPTGKQLAERLDISDATVFRALGLPKLPGAVREQVESGELAPAVAYEVQDPAEQAEVAARVVAEGPSRAETVEAVRQVASKPGAGGSKGRGAIRARPKRPTSRTFKATSARVTVEFKKAADPAEVLAATEEATARVRAELGGDQAAS